MAVFGRLPRPEAKARQEQIWVHAGNGEVVLRCDGFLPRFWGGALLSAAGFALLWFVASDVRRRALVARAVSVRARALVALGRARAWASARDKGPPALAGGTVIAVLLLLMASRRGALDLLPPPIEGNGMTAWAKGADGAWRKCTAAWWKSGYSCPDAIPELDPIAHLDAGLGLDALPDDAGEFRRMFPGLRLAFARPHTMIELRFSRVALAGRLLKITADTYGAFTFSGSVAGMPVLEKHFEGVAFEAIRPPRNAPRSGDVVLRFESLSASSNLVFRGVLE